MVKGLQPCVWNGLEETPCPCPMVIFHKVPNMSRDMFIKKKTICSGHVLRKWTGFWTCQIHFGRVLERTILLIIFSKKLNGTNISYIMSYMTCEYKAIKPLIPNQNINLEVLDSHAYINSSTTTPFNIMMSKIIIEGKLSKRTRVMRIKASKISNFKLVQALQPGRVRLHSQAGLVGSPMQLPLCMCFFFKFLN
jgi:hypothetical protein